jgi:hypothetical protein
MMADNGIAKVQHYVPQFLLRNFGNGKKEQVHVFDKKTERSFSTNARNIAAESRFYDFEIEGETYTLEPGLSQIEGDAKKLIQRIIDEDSLLSLTAQDKADLAVFFSIQLTRTRSYREQWKEIPKMLEQKLQTMVSDGDDLEGVKHYFQVPDENEIKIQTAQMMIQAPQDYAKYFVNKDWLLLKTDRKRPFVISDNPLALQNMIDMEPLGNLGLAVKGIEIYFPLSPTRALAMWCPSLREMCNKAVGNIRYLPNFVRRLLANHKILEIEKILVSIETGKPLLYHPKHVTNFNSLQIAQSERYIFSCDSDFSLAQDMINRHSSMKNGPRMKSN